MKSERATSAIARMFGIGLLAAGIVLAAPTAAFAAGTGYTPGAPAPGGTATGLPGNVVSTTTIQPSGGTANATIGSTSITVTVPAGAFTGPVQLVVTDASSSAVAAAGGASTVVTFGVGFYVNGTKVTGTFPAVTITVSSPSITAGSTVYFVTASGLQAVSGDSVQAGSATFTITSDPVVEVATPVAISAAAGVTATGAAITGATSAQTGKPFFLESLIAAGLLALGTLLLVGLLVRRRTA
jgi:hypothetical protein